MGARTIFVGSIIYVVEKLNKTHFITDYYVINPYFQNKMNNMRVIITLFLGLCLLWACTPKQSSVMSSTGISESVPSAEDAVEEAADEVVITTNHPKVTKEIPCDTRLITGKLSNGLTYYIQKNAKPENRAELRLAVNAGSILEDDDQKGLAHFVEHMAFNGTENFEKSELVDYLESVGTRFGPDLNAYTSFDETVYMLQVRTDSTELFDKGLLILKDWAGGVTFDHEEIDKERGVVESEWRSRLSPDQRMQNKTFPVLYQGSQYAERLPIGDPEIIRNADYEVFKRFYRDWYRPDLQAVVVVGDIDVAEVEAKIKSMFGELKPRLNPRERTQFNVPRHPETLVSVASDKEASFTNVSLVYKQDKIKTETLDDYRNSLVRFLFNDMLNARLEELSKSPDPPYMYGYTFYSGDVGDIDAYRSFAMVPEGKAKAALTALITENKRVLMHGFTEGEMERAKSRMMERAEKGYKEMDKTESGRIVMRYVYKYLDDNPTPSPKQTLDMYSRYLPTIQLSEVNALPSQWIRDDSRVVTVTGPLKADKPLPQKSEIMTMLSELDNVAPEPYVDDVASEPFFTETLSAQGVSAMDAFDNVDVDYMELDNGVEVYMKKTDFKNDEILMSATSPGGTSLYGDDEYFDAQQATRIISEAGIGNFSSTQLDKMMAGKTVSVNPYIGTLSEGMNGSSSPDDMEIMFQMIYKYFQAPRMDEEAFTSYVTKQKGIYANLMSNPNFYFSDYVSKLKYGNHPRAGFATVEDWEGMDYKRAMDFYKDRFADASDFTFFFVGNYDEAKIKSYIQTYLGNLPSINREETWKDTGMKPVKGGINGRVANGIAPKTNVQLYFHGDYDYSDDNNYVMNSMIAYLRIKLREALREDMGGVYGVRLSGGGSKKPREQYSITVSFNADPPMADTLIQAAKQVIATAIAEGPSEEDMQKVKETQRQNRIKDLEQNRFWQRQISREVDNDKNFDNILLESLEARISGLTADQIQGAIGKYFNYENFMEIVMEPEKKDEGRP